METKNKDIFKQPLLDSKVQSFQKLTSYFMKKGNRSKIETNVRTFLQNKGKLKIKKKVLLTQVEKSMNKIMPYVRLLVRKRGKRYIYKIGYLEKKKAEKKAYLSVSKILKENKTDYFLTLLQKELETISLKKSNLIVKRNLLHKTAKQAAPYKWSKKRNINLKTFRKNQKISLKNKQQGLNIYVEKKKKNVKCLKI